MIKPLIDPKLETREAIAAVDDILAGVGLSHGSRASRANTWWGGERRLQGVKREKASKAQAEPAPAVEVLHGKVFARAESLVHGFSTRGGGVSTVYRPWLPEGRGDLNLGFTAQDDAEHVRENRRRARRASSGLPCCGSSIRPS